jgi:hypothetical protein
MPMKNYKARKRPGINAEPRGKDETGGFQVHRFREYIALYISNKSAGRKGGCTVYLTQDEAWAISSFMREHCREMAKGVSFIDSQTGTLEGSLIGARD